MDWKTMLAYITGSVDQELLSRNEYLVAENRILRNQLHGGLRLADGERRTLAEMGKQLGQASTRRGSEHRETRDDERNHQGKGNLLLFPASEKTNRVEGPVCCRERLGGLLRHYYREAA